MADNQPSIPPWDHPDIDDWRYQITVLIRALMDGKLSNGTVTITNGDTTTTIVDSRLGELSNIFFAATTAEGAAILDTIYTSTRSRGSAIITHADPGANAELGYLITN